MLTVSVFDPETNQWRDLPIDVDGHSDEFAAYLDSMIAELPPLDSSTCTPSNAAPSAAPFNFLYPASFTSGGDAA
ncbi:hypothetical protein H6F43_06940 [Leptolyngbya sp. FACHB-36]|uniref:hypothetical protein n=1 Tax=Leptolyngbya sp. FACHB-36 TaxID=2692808 RepID=UPI0016816BF9|nr:hypothetical protein [Leptolyngbya sp. FACHB-36]MBD2019922.1 hypothetical protein [Leptolyngbya sp. FACHB-36]